MDSTTLISIDTVSNIQKELDSYDCRSLLFLLYDNPVIALQRITENYNALKQWAVDSALDHNWQEKFIESLAICKLYEVIKKLGLNLSQVKVRYSPQVIGTSVYIDPVKKLFYFTSEQIRNKDLNIIKTNLRFEIDAEAQDTKDLEIIILKVLCEGKNMGKLLAAIAKIPSMTSLVLQIRERLSDKLQSELSVNNYVSASTVETHSSNKYYECTDSDRILNTKMLDYYPIKNIRRVGFAYIINQQYFNNNVTNDYELANRNGSDIDKEMLKITLTKLNFKVFASDNLTAKEIVCNIAKIVNDCFISTDSIFLLCILSHGIQGQIFGTDCIPVKIKEIQKVIDSDGKGKLKNIPKVIFLQACQVFEKLVADAPLAIDYLIHWATSSEYEAYRGVNGSIFIQILCRMLSNHGQKEHLVDICTKVNNYVNERCMMQNLEQLPNIKSTLRKKLYLYPPL